MRLLKLFKKLKDDLGTKHMQELFLKLGEGDLLKSDQKVIDNWVNAHEGRKTVFEKFRKVTTFQRRVSAAHGTEIRGLVIDLYNAFPHFFATNDEKLTPFTLPTGIQQYLKQLAWKHSHQIVYGKRGIMIITYVVRALMLALAIYLIVQLIK